MQCIVIRLLDLLLYFKFLQTICQTMDRETISVHVNHMHTIQLFAVETSRSLELEMLQLIGTYVHIRYKVTSH